MLSVLPSCWRTTRHCVAVACSFLALLPSDSELEPARLSTAEVNVVVLPGCRRCKTASAKAMTTRLPSLLRYLHVEDLTSVVVAGGVPGVTHSFPSCCLRPLGRAKLPVSWQM